MSAVVDPRSIARQIIGPGNIELYNGSAGTLDSRGNINELNQPPIVLVCSLLRQLPSGIPATLANTCDGLAPVIQGLVPLPSPAEVIVSLQQGKLPPLPLPLATAGYGSKGATR